MSCPTPDKIPFAYQHSAEAAMRHTHELADRGWDAPVRAYKCRCQKWHLTTKREQW
jgi:hypothetical protein